MFLSPPIRPLIRVCVCFTATTQQVSNLSPSAHFKLSEGMADDEQSQLTRRRTYNVTPLSLFGVEVSGIDLRRPVERETVDVIKEDVARYRLMVFRGQGVISAHRQVEISHWFGELDCPFYNHPASAHPEVFRVSNDEHEGCVGVGRTGWHIDGSFQECPYSHSIYHIISVPSRGDTVFTPLHEVVESLTDEQHSRWDRLYMVADRRGGLVHPLLYLHPVTGKEV
ncbi:(R)-phenoxypropionate/alpha-ketoglutarate-dioxygenase [Geodia barretti]|uniref:(R)-phenoxypropionate/alpha-ketoglutarate-dioxyge nase n=1 Tax=Geodia barretti TaxID=519541 RepID=A0AA35R6U5_GEOBA|nr:(R)-phenoxypropionate/alpha-ketoglutarate-dioxygenase [Geodia barretti]